MHNLVMSILVKTIFPMAVILDILCRHGRTGMATEGMARRKRQVLLDLPVAVALGVAFAIWPAAGRAEPGQDPQPQIVIRTLAQGAIAAMADSQLSDAEREDHFRRLFVSSFDIPEIGRFVLARYWRTATPDQQQDFLKLFEDINVLTWAQRFKDYHGETVETLGTTKDGDRGWIVDSRIMRVQAPPIPVQWRIRQAEDGSFRIVDIIVEGVSMAITYRSDYTAAIQSNGGRVDSLLAVMRGKLDQLKTAS